MSTDKERLEIVLAHLRMNPNELAKSLGYTRTQRIYFVLNERNGISDSFARDICKKYPDINFQWLKNGNGDMLTATKASETAIGSAASTIGKSLTSSVAGINIGSTIGEGLACADVTFNIGGIVGSFFNSLFDGNDDVTEEEAVEVLKEALEDHKRISEENEELKSEVEYWRSKANNLEYQLSKTKAG